MNKFLKFLDLLKGQKRVYFGAFIALSLATLLNLINPLIIRTTIDSIIGNKPIEGFEFIKEVVSFLGGRSYLAQNIWIAGIFIVSLTLLSGLMQFLKGKWVAEASEKMTQNLREKVYDHLQHLPFDYHVKAETGDLVQRCTSDIDTVRKFMAAQVLEVSRGLLMIAIVLPIMLSLNVKMTLISLAVLPLIFAFGYIFFMKVKVAFKRSDEAEGKLSAVLQENLTGVRVVRAFAREKYEIDKFEEKNEYYRSETYKLIRLLAVYWSVSDLFCFGQIITVLSVGVYYAATGVISLGTMVVFMTYVGSLLWPIRNMGRVLTDMGKAQVAMGRINEILDVEIEDNDENDNEYHVGGNIEFKDVSFSYEKDHNVLKNVSFKVNKGETIAILGPTGSGKSTLMNLLPRLYDYDSGSIEIDGLELKRLNRKFIRSKIGIVLQEPFLYSKTLKDNIGLSSKEVIDEDVFNASRIACIHDVIEAFDKGYETPVGENGVTLSGGQKQRVAIARAIVQESPILIFDDSLSAVDTETDALIRKALNDRNKETTTFIISHRVTTLAEADKILVMEHGEIVQEGTHQELIKEEGLYQRIWSLQNKLEDELNVEMDNEQNKSQINPLSKNKETKKRSA